MKACTEWVGTRNNNCRSETTVPSELQSTVCAENERHQTAEMSSIPERERRVYPQRWQRDDDF